MIMVVNIMEDCDTKNTLKDIEDMFVMAEKLKTNIELVNEKIEQHNINKILSFVALTLYSFLGVLFFKLKVVTDSPMIIMGLGILCMYFILCWLISRSEIGLIKRNVQPDYIALESLLRYIRESDVINSNDISSVNQARFKTQLERFNIGYKI